MDKKEVQKAKLENLVQTSNEHSEKLEGIGAIGDVELRVRVEFSRIRKPIKEVLGFKVGDVIKLNRYDGELVDIYVGERLVAKGEITVMDDKFAVRVTEFLDSSKQL